MEEDLFGISKCTVALITAGKCFALRFHHLNVVDFEHFQRAFRVVVGKHLCIGSRSDDELPFKGECGLQ